ncbi:GYF domain-containing protein [Brevibacillus borstelensis]|uniref:GYF domain-containing protein n=1 Tax=Brevibacillus borstelensis TaxID=45462 RepID=UPI0030C394BC
MAIQSREAAALRVEPDIKMLQAICLKYREQFLRYVTHEELTPSQLKTIFERFPLSPGERILAFVDTTLLGSRKLGMALTLNGIYWRSEAIQPGFITQLSWGQFLEVKLGIFGKYDLRLGTDGVFNTAGCNRELLTGLLKELQIYIASLQADGLPVPFETGMPSKKKWNVPVKAAGEAEWMLVANGEMRGPLAANIMMWVAETGQIDLETSHVWKRGMKEWLKIKEAAPFATVRFKADK